jgi:diguanylate cyclase (GGDEF)-like protein
MNIVDKTLSFISSSSRPLLLLICLIIVVAVSAMDIYWNLAAQIALFAVLALLTTAIKDSLAREKEAARRDPLTGALNGKAFIELAWRELNRSRRYKQTFSLAYMDVDGLRLVNEKFGRTSGDSLLLKITEAVKGNLRNVDAMSRLGGDEFAVMLPETGHDGAVVVMGRLRNLLADIVKNNGWPATFSMGVVTYKTSPDDVDSMVTRAERLMSQAKAAGKDMIRYDVY